MTFGDFVGLATTLAILFVAFPAVLMKGIARLRQAKASSGDALRVSELERMIAEAVAHATAPLKERIETLEAIATERDEPAVRLSAPSRDRVALPAMDDADEVAAPRTRVRA